MMDINVFSTWMSNGVVSKGYTSLIVCMDGGGCGWGNPKSLSKVRSQIASLVAFEVAIYSASAVDSATVGCFLMTMRCSRQPNRIRTRQSSTSNQDPEPSLCWTNQSDRFCRQSRQTWGRNVLCLSGNEARALVPHNVVFRGLIQTVREHHSHEQYQDESGKHTVASQSLKIIDVFERAHKFAPFVIRLGWLW